MFITANIEKIFRNTKIHIQDLPYQRILWRFDKNGPIGEYELLTLTFGFASAPYLPEQTLQQLAKEEEQSYPEASRITLEDLYVDDFRSGADDLSYAWAFNKNL